jgi:hypothetical protein
LAGYAPFDQSDAVLLRSDVDFLSLGPCLAGMEMRMELRHLRYFVAVADAGSLTVAAERSLHTSQPSLSRQIRDLEDEVGTQLLTRSAVLLGALALWERWHPDPLYTGRCSLRTVFAAALSRPGPSFPQTD